MLSREQEEPEVAPVETLISSRLVVTGRAPGEEQLAGRCRTELARWSLSVLSLELTVARMRLINRILSGVTGSSQSRVKSSQAPPLEWHPVHSRIFFLMAVLGSIFCVVLKSREISQQRISGPPPQLQKCTKLFSLSNQQIRLG